MTDTLPSTVIESPAPALDERLGVPVTHHMLPRWWGRQHVVDTGPHDGPVIVLLHGWPQHWYAWRHILRALSAEARLIAIDTRAFGWSDMAVNPATRRAITSVEIAEDVATTIAELGLGRVHLVGHDWGGWFAFRAAIEHPALFQSVLALAIMPPWLDAKQVRRRWTRLAYLWPMGLFGHLAADRPVVVRALLRRSTGNRRTWLTSDGREAVTTYTERLRPRPARLTTRWLYRRMVKVELKQATGPRPERLSMPATVQLGSHESISHVDMFMTRTEPGEITVETVVLAGHWLLDEAPEPVVDRLRAQAGLSSSTRPSDAPGSPTL